MDDESTEIFETMFADRKDMLRKGKGILRSKDAKVRQLMGNSNADYAYRGIGAKENPPAYSETAQEIKKRKAAEKRARRSGQALQ